MPSASSDDSDDGNDEKAENSSDEAVQPPENRENEKNRCFLISLIFTQWIQVPMIHKIIEAAKHAELLRRVEEELDNIAKEIAEPNIHIHWPIIQNPVHTSIKVHFR